jgi:N-methylhydantoinase B/oxoprolinase/acetone carboxylase alpha subunit
MMGPKTLIDRLSLPNSASLLNVDILLPPDSIVNPQPPASCIYYFALLQAFIARLWRRVRGDPRQREPYRVLRDVRDEYVSIEEAERDDGVVIRAIANPIRRACR